MLEFIEKSHAWTENPVLEEVCYAALCHAGLRYDVLCCALM